MHNSTLTRVVLFRHSLLSLFIVLSSFFQADCQVRARANLLIIDNNGSTLMDGNMTNYDAQYSNLVDNYDIYKMSNFGENLGILRSTANLVIERRKTITSNDTTYFRMWNLRQFNYSLQVIIENMHMGNLTGFVHDNFTNQDIPVDLNDTTYINFTVTSQAGTYAANRFKLIFVVPVFATLPVTFTSLKAYRSNDDVMVNWEVENEISMDRYIVEYAADGVHFKELQEVNSSNTSIKKTYNMLHLLPGPGNQFYRIKAISLGGRFQYSSIARLNSAIDQSALNVYPNPVVNKTLQMQVKISQPGLYGISLVSIDGGKQELSSLVLAAGQNLQTVHLPKTLAAGIYRLQLTAPDQSVSIKTITVL